MKTLIVLFLSITASFASDVVVNSLTSVTVDGQPAGSVVDVLANHDAGDVRAKLLDALIARERNIQSLQTQAVAEANAARLEKESAVKAEQSKNEELRAAILSGDQSKLAAACLDEKEKRAAEIQTQIEALQRQKSEIEK